jgi:poly-beta-1,6-N-acetyl-D-glucosamine synthase
MEYVKSQEMVGYISQQIGLVVEVIRMGIIIFYGWCTIVIKFNWRWWFGINKPKEWITKPYTISVIIPAYNEAKSIGETIDSVKNQSITITKIIVVDDFSSDNTGDVARAKGATVIRTPVNQGTKAQAQNYAIQFIDTDLLVTIDADTTLDKYAIERTLPYFSDEKTASVCGTVIPKRIKSVWERGRFIEYLFGIWLFKAAQNNVNAVMVSSGCFSVFRTNLLQEMGGFKPRTMAEDMDLTWEFHFKGYKIFLSPNSYCYPIDPPNYKIYVDQITRWYSSFFQNITLHWRSLLHNKLGFFIFFYLFDGLILPFVVFSALFLYTGNGIKAIGIATLVELFLVGIPSLIAGGKAKLFWETLISLPCIFIVRIVNASVFFKCVWNEWVVRKRLVVWDKGH